MKPAADALFRAIARTPLARPALRAVARLGRAGPMPAQRAVAAARALAAGLGDEASTILGEVSVDDSGHRFELACDLRFEHYRHLFFGTRRLGNDRLALHLMTTRLADYDVVCDVGANAGIFTYGAIASGARRIHAFEPIPRLAALLRANAARAGGGSRVSVEEVLVGAEAGTATFYVLSSDVESTMIAERAAARDVVQELTIPVVRMDAFCEREGIEPARSFFKIDVEGNELEALAGFGGLLDRPDAPDIVTELLGVSLQQGAIERLAARGYQVYYLAPGGPIRVHSGADWSPHQDLACWDFFLTKRGWPK